mgnify:CR=1 FL=1
MTALSPPPALPDIGPVRARRRLFATPRAITALMLREMSTSYGRSPGGYIWAVLEPAAGIALLTAIFATGFRAPSLGTNFAIFYATGILPFYLYLMTSNVVMQSVMFSRQLLAYPSVTFVDAILARFLLQLLTQLLVSYILFSFIIGMFDTRTSLEFDRLLLAYAMAASLGLGVGVLNCFLRSMFPVWQQVWGIMTRPLLLVSGVIFLIERIPEPYRGWLEYNPLVHVVGMSRTAFYPYYNPQNIDPVYVFSVSLIALVTGLVFLRRYKHDILHY